MSDPAAEIRKALAELEEAASTTGQHGSRGVREPERKRKRATRRRRWSGRRLVGLTLTALVAILLPFWVLVRGTTILALEAGWGPWGSLAGAAVATTALIGVYAWGASRKLGVGTGRWLPRLSAGVVMAYCAYGLLFMSPRQFKGPEVQETWSSMHPALRMALATMVLVDSDAVITDGARRPEDYAGMNLPVNARSLHFEQTDGYVHAVDLRTLGRPEWLNAAVTVYLRSVGISVLRHVGTADHLHVYLSPAS